MCLEDFDFGTPKTKQTIDLLKKLNLSDKKTLMVLAQSNKNVFLSSRNLGQVEVVTASQLNTYDVLNASNLVLTEGSVKEIEKMFT
jgi:large subunit ribosomal protein L4